jgi:hypothetical protein
MQDSCLQRCQRQSVPLLLPLVLLPLLLPQVLATSRMGQGRVGCA